MAIKKQEFYEGAALYRLARTGDLRSIRYDAPFFTINENLLAYLKYSTRSRSPWGFTFTTDEQEFLRARNSQSKIVIGLICGSDGIVALPYDSFISMVEYGKSSVRIACRRRFDQHYSVEGPRGKLDRKIAPSAWARMITR